MRRFGVAEVIARDDYHAGSAIEKLKLILSDDRYRKRAEEAAAIVRSEGGTDAACDAIESRLKPTSQNREP